MYTHGVPSPALRLRAPLAASFLLAAAALAAHKPALADAPAPALVRLLRSAARPSRPHPLADPKGRVAVTASIPKGASAESFGLLPVAPGIGAIHLDPDELDA